MRRIAVRLLLTAAATAATLVVAEGVVRAVRDPRTLERQEQRAIFPTYYPLAEGGMFTRDSDERLRYRLTPGFDMTLDGDRYRVSSPGFRGSEIRAQTGRPPSRIVVLGDSFAFGLGVDEDETFPAQLETLLAASAGQPVEILNLGVPGYHTGQELAWRERAGLPRAPALVVLLYYGNDEIGEAFQYDPGFGVLYGDALPLPYRLKGVLARSAIYRWIARLQIGRMRARGELSSEDPRHWPVTRRRLEGVFSACSQRGVPLLLANLPLLASSAALRSPDWPGQASFDRVTDLAERAGIPVVDLRASLLARQEGPGDDFLRRLLISPDPPEDHHLTPEGYRIVADAVAEVVIANRLLDRS
jgi:lysophospholipase L1-like esterase